MKYFFGRKFKYITLWDKLKLLFTPMMYKSLEEEEHLIQTSFKEYKGRVYIFDLRIYPKENTEGGCEDE